MFQLKQALLLAFCIFNKLDELIIQLFFDNDRGVSLLTAIVHFFCDVQEV